MTKKFLHSGRQEDFLESILLQASSEAVLLQSSRADKEPAISSWFEAQDYGVQSKHSGGARLAAALGIPDRYVMHNGGWKSETSNNR